METGANLGKSFSCEMDSCYSLSHFGCHSDLCFAKTVVRHTFKLTPLRAEVVMVSKEDRLGFMYVFVVQKHLSHSVPHKIGQCGLCLTFPLI